jgi:O-antigen/teichoic acid export membrane protein
MGVYIYEKKKFLFDSLLNIIATSIPVLTLQLVILPIVGANLGSDQYGLVITLISLVTLMSFPFGNVLNNIRLLLDKEYKERNIIGDFNILLIGSIIISSIFVIVGTIYYNGSFSIKNITFMVTISFLTLLRDYLLVSFRIELNYKAILINNVVLVIGYLTGTLVFYLSGYWQLIYIVGLAFSLLYILNNTSLLKEKFTITKNFKVTFNKSLILFCSSFLKTILTYADKLLLFPLLGPTAVSIYYSATIIGKIISMIITPVNGVVLSYLTQVSNFERKRFIHIILITSILGVIGYFLSIVISYPLLNLLYPNWASESLKLIYITSASVILEVVSSVINPFILRYNKINWQLYLSGTNVIVYIICTVVLFKTYGLIGFCIGVLVANAIKLILMINIFNINNKKMV